MPLSNLYARRNRAPTRTLYDVTIAAPAASLSTSPCYVDDPYEYHIATYLTDEMRATADGLSATIFSLRPTLLR